MRDMLMTSRRWCYRCGCPIFSVTVSRNWPKMACDACFPADPATMEKK